MQIFDFYRLDAIEHSQGLPWKWHRLAHVCRKWRDVVFRSPRRLGLRILCESGPPIESILATWPTLPLVAKSSATPESRNIPRNVIVADHASTHVHIASSPRTKSTMDYDPYYRSYANVQSSMLFMSPISPKVLYSVFCPT